MIPTQTNMFYREFRPSPVLAPYVECFWILRAPENPFTSLEHLTADSRIEFMLNFAGPYRRRDRHGRAHMQRQSNIVGVRKQAFWIEQFGAIHYVSARFRPGGLSAFVRFSLSELANQVIDLNSIWGSSTLLEEQVFEAVSDERRIEIFEQYLQQRLQEKPHQRQLNAALHLLEQTEKPIPALAAELGLSQKHFERLFVQHIGLTPKTHQRIRRFQRVLQLAVRLPNLTRLAFDVGYYDQSHFIRDFKVFSGTTPGQFFAGQHKIAEMITPA